MFPFVVKNFQNSKWPTRLAVLQISRPGVDSTVVEIGLSIDRYSTVCMTMKLTAARGEVREHLTYICACAESSSKTQRGPWCESRGKHETSGVTPICFYAQGRFDIQQRYAMLGWLQNNEMFVKGLWPDVVKTYFERNSGTVPGVESGWMAANNAHWIFWR